MNKTPINTHGYTESCSGNCRLRGSADLPEESIILRPLMVARAAAAKSLGYRWLATRATRTASDQGWAQDGCERLAAAAR